MARSIGRPTVTTPPSARPRGHVALDRALSKLGVLSRAEARRLVIDGRVRVSGHVAKDPGLLVVPERAAIEVDGAAVSAGPWRLLLLHKPRGVVTTRSDPQGRRTVYDLLPTHEPWLAPVGRLDLASSGLLLLTNDTRLAAWLTDPANGIPRTYIVTVRGWLADEDVEHLRRGIVQDGEALAADEADVLKRSRRETHVRVVLREGRNREVRRLCESVGREVTRLLRVAFGGMELGRLAPNRCREVSRREAEAAWPGAPLRRGAG